MAHLQQQQFCTAVRKRFPRFFKNKLVLDIGSLDINGNNQYLFDGCAYLGVDVATGRNVDIVCAGHQLLLPDGTFDVIVSTECFEHDQYYPETLRNIYRMLKPGGLFFFSCATTGRPEHGTRRTNPGDAPLIQGLGDWADYYRNLEEADIRAVFDVEAEFSEFEFSIGHETKDLYFYGIKSGRYHERDDYSFLLESHWFAQLADQLRTQLAQSREEAGALKEQLERAKLDAFSLQQQLMSARADSDELRNSTSWRITAPLRALGDALRSVRRHPAARALSLVAERPELLGKFVGYVRQRGLREALRHARNVGHRTQMSPRDAGFAFTAGSRCVILTTPHCHFVARLIQSALERAGLQAQIIHAMPSGGFEDVLHFVICPQIFPKLPGTYVAFQMEQSVSSRWFKQDYLDILDHAYAIFDYSLTNIAFLQSKGMSYRQIYYLPIGFDADMAPLEGQPSYEYDVLFYGDVNNDRRRQYLEQLGRHFKVKVVRELFGAPLYEEMAKAKVVVNIHYYEGALLETTRVYECLSQNKLVVSESSSDIAEHDALKSIVDFVPVGDVQAMIERIGYWLDHDEARRQRIVANRNALLKPGLSFDYYFFRFLLANDVIDFDRFYELAGAGFSIDSEMVCLGLPESIARQASFRLDNQYGIQAFPGLRHQLGWVGCGLSYKFLFRKAREQGLAEVAICEDDVDFLPGWQDRYRAAQRYLAESGDWDIFSGLIANLHVQTAVSDLSESEGATYVHLDKMVSTVMNVYSARMFDRLESWDPAIRDAERNTYDRYVERMPGVRIVTTMPFLVGHKDEEVSTLWGFNNTVYVDLIRASEQLLEEKVIAFRDARKKIA
ncbi:Methyltransferase domain protein [Pigmentiphaga humi]|uniref:Methyltransferase domain protein n=1 Tax=Pigmentiphaga humi TaxID=2478468 RepID=A0A3P4B2S7_9BURK|nr:methyltransferase domain-containing protein [Pigmentiphaga humi]VCU69455.1 Methyltransferase domain protein [Pigmentiphaga humi]